MNAFTVRYDGGIAFITLDIPGEKVNKFSAEIMAELGEVVRLLHEAKDVRAAVFSSGKPGVFIAGADIRELQSIHATDEALTKAQAGQRLFQRVAELPMPTIAVIDGACLGGGLEFALACTQRILVDEEKTSLGLPEVTLGIIPGWGGTQRLPRLIGYPAALEMILAGKAVNARKALKLGLGGACVARAFVGAEVKRMIAALSGRITLPPRQSSLSQRLIEHTPIGRMIMFNSARSSLMAKTHGLLPAPLHALEVLRSTAGMTMAEGMAIEAKHFAELAISPTSKALIDCFFANEAVRKEGQPQGGAPLPPSSEVQSAGVLGAGVMGGGISWAFAQRGISVRLKDLSWDAIAKGLRTAHDYNQQLQRIRKLTPGQANLTMHRIGGTLDFSGFANLDMVVEAVVEDLTVKRKVLAELEGHIRDDCWVGTNTSSLSVTAMASAMRHPERLVGMHFFNPVNRMPLVEVVPGSHSDPAVVAGVAALVRRLGKTAVVVKDVPGFLVNRILLPYLNEAARCLEDGADLARIDRIITDFGMPMGPFTLSDEVGLDVGFKVASILADAYGERMRVADTLRVAYQDLHLLGTKGGSGFFVHHGSRRVPNPALLAGVAALRQRANDSGISRVPADYDIRDRCLLIMVNEAARCLEEAVVSRPAVLDLAMIMGTGFPPQRGGLLHYANELGSRTVADRLTRLQERCGARFKPCQLILDLARDGRPFPT